MNVNKFLILIVGLLYLGGANAGIGANAAKRRTQARDSQGSETRSVWDGVYTEEQAKRGEELYRKECASCHGYTLVGGVGAALVVGVLAGVHPAVRASRLPPTEALATV